MTGKACALWL